MAEVHEPKKEIGVVIHGDLRAVSEAQYGQDLHYTDVQSGERAHGP